MIKLFEIEIEISIEVIIKWIKQRKMFYIGRIYDLRFQIIRNNKSSQKV